jgi:hypothetical protein
MAEAFEFASQFLVVIDLAVEHDRDISVVGKNGLVARAEVYDFETGCTDGAEARLEHTLLVRPAM